MGAVPRIAIIADDSTPAASIRPEQERQRADYRHPGRYCRGVYRNLERNPMTDHAPDYPYVNHMDVKYPPLEIVDVPDLVATCRDQWYNQTLVQVNDAVVRLGIMQGEYHWHKHDNDDEFFLVLDGRFLIDLEGRTITLEHQQGVVVPKGVMHRPRAPHRAVVLMMETANIAPTGDR